MRRKAALADGHSPSTPILGVTCIRKRVAELAEVEPGYRVRPRRNRVAAWPLFEVGLLHGAAGLGLEETGRIVGCSGSTAGLRLQRHRQVLLKDDAYALRTAEILKALLHIAYPGGVPE